MSSPRKCALWLLLAFVLGLTAFPRSQADETIEGEQIAQLIRQLGARRFAQRESAVQALVHVGEPALEALRKAATAADPEIRRQSQLVIEKITPHTRKSKFTGMQMVLIETGEFSMGSPNIERQRRAEEIPHRVRITRPFYMGSYEVTQAEFERVMQVNPSEFARSGKERVRVLGLDTANFPVEQVTWFDALEFCNRLSKQDGYPPAYQLSEVKRPGANVVAAQVRFLGGRGYRLPTEAEWEYACRARTTSVWHFGDQTRAGVGNMKPLEIASGYGTVLKWPNLERPTSVGSYAANAWGLHDMHGNVGEWCEDWYDRNYYAVSPRQDPRGPSKGTHRVVRGGNWLLPEEDARSACRFWRAPGEPSYLIGFRVVRVP